MSVIKLTPFEDPSEAVEKAKQIYLTSKAELDRYIDHIIKEVLKSYIYNHGKTKEFSEFIERFKDDEKRNDDITSLRYPLIMVRPYFYHHTLRDSVNYYQRSANFYASNFTRLDIDTIYEKLVHKLCQIQAGISPGFYTWRDDMRPPEADFRPMLPIYVGKSATSIPINFAFDDEVIKQKINKACSAQTLDEDDRSIVSEKIIQVIQNLFSMPSLLNINDNIVNALERRDSVRPIKYQVIPSTFHETFTKVNENTEAPDFKFQIDDNWEKTDKSARFLDFVKKDSEWFNIGEGLKRQDVRSLAFYSAPRTDYSYGRLEHYTHTKFVDFQPYILMTNYKNYIEAFLKTMVLKHVLNDQGKLYLPTFKLDETLEKQLSDDIKEWLKSDHLILDQEKAQTFLSLSEEPSYIIDGGQNKISKLPLTQWVSLWTHNCHAQMPAYHFAPHKTIQQAEVDKFIKTFDWEPDDEYEGKHYCPGITIVNIGVGPSNAKNITDHLAVLRPEAWLMIGHCGGLRTTQRVGDFVLAQSYVREDRVLDDELPQYVPVPEITEVTEALYEGAADVLFERYAEKQADPHIQNPKNRIISILKKVKGDNQEVLQGTEVEKDIWKREQLRGRLRIGTVVTHADRNWELNPLEESIERFEQSRAVAIDMESATIAANGLRHRVAYGTLLCVSDLPVFGSIKLRGMATEFYKEATATHLEIGIEAIKRLVDKRYKLAASRKIHGFDDPLLG